MYSGQYDDYACVCSECERPGQGHSCDFELAFPCCNCLCDSCAGAADYQWLGELRAQVRQAKAMLQTDADKVFAPRKHWLAQWASICGDAAFLPRIEDGRFEFESSPDYETAKECTMRASCNGSLSSDASYYDIEIGEGGKFKSVWCGGNDLLERPENAYRPCRVTKHKRREALADFESVHSDASAEWRSLYKRFFYKPGSLSRYEYVQLIAGKVVKKKKEKAAPKRKRQEQEDESEAVSEPAGAAKKACVAK